MLGVRTLPCYEEAGKDKQMLRCASYILLQAFVKTKAGNGSINGDGHQGNTGEHLNLKGKIGNYFIATYLEFCFLHILWRKTKVMFAFIGGEFFVVFLILVCSFGLISYSAIFSFFRKVLSHLLICTMSFSNHAHLEGNCSCVHKLLFQIFSLQSGCL